MINRVFWTGVLLAVPVVAGALGLGGISVDSFLDQPLEAQIELISPGQVEAEDIRVSLAGPEVFAKAGLDRPYLLSQLTFRSDIAADGRAVIRVSTSQAVREPFLDFLVELSWPGGRLLKEYTVLLDPPRYEPRAAVVEAPGKILNATGERDVRQGRSLTYGPVRKSETLWVIARNTRPDRSISVEQMMMALQRLNPAAFRRGNVNLLRQGVVLEIPDREFIRALSVAEARAQFAQQTRDWKAMGKRTADQGSGPASVLPQTARAVSSGQSPRHATVRAVPGHTPQEANSGEKASAQQPRVQGEAHLSVVEPEPVSPWGVGDQMESTQGYPYNEQDRLKEAVADSKQDVLAAREINQDLERLQDILEQQIQALRRSLQEKDREIDELRRIVSTAEAQSETRARRDATSQVSGFENTLDGEQVELAEMEPIPPLATQEPAPPQAILSWIRHNWLELTVAAAFLLLLVTWMRPRRPTVNRHQEVSSFRSYTVLDQEPLLETGSGQVADSFRSYTEEQGLFPEIGEDAVSILTKADIYLAYRQYDQAVSLVRESLRVDPGNCLLQAKLLEIYAFRKDENGFVQFLEEVHEPMSRQEPEIWAKVVGMGRELVPNHPLIISSRLPGEARLDSSLDELLSMEQTFDAGVVTPGEGDREQSLSLVGMEPDLQSRSNRS